MYTHRQNLGLPCVYVSKAMIHFYKVKYKYKYIIGEKFKKKLQTRQSRINVRAQWQKTKWIIKNKQSTKGHTRRIRNKYQSETGAFKCFKTFFTLRRLNHYLNIILISYVVFKFKRYVNRLCTTFVVEWHRLSR